MRPTSISPGASRRASGASSCTAVRGCARSRATSVEARGEPAMLQYAAKRIALGLLILIVVMTAMYAAVFLIPGDPASMALGPRATPELKRMLTERMGLDRPLYVQIFNFFRNAVTGNLGYDVWSNRPVSTLVFEALPNTVILGFASLGWAIALGVPI